MIAMSKTVVFCSAEVAPFSKVGGLADVMGSLPKAFDTSVVSPVVITPRYGLIDPETHNLSKLPFDFSCELNGQDYPISVWEGTLPHSSVPVYFIDSPDLISNRDAVYPYGNADLEVNSFLLFGKAIFELIHRLGLEPDILHCQDWHTANVVVELKERRQHDARFKNTRSIFTIHNLAYQGKHNNRNWMSEGLTHADFLTTVSPTYAQEIQTDTFGEGLSQILRDRRDSLTGILNGIDTDLFNPATDNFIPQTYSHGNFKPGKSACKAALQNEMGLETRPGVPLFGFVSRLADQKGLDILLPVLEEMKDARMQVVILGTGDPVYEARLKELNEQSKNIRTFIGFNLSMAQKIYAGSDIFLMPSRFEPCGLGQLIALRYGTLPLARMVGGLKDTVFNVDNEPQKGNGFTFNDYKEEAVKGTIEHAISVYGESARWNTLVDRAMNEDHSWPQSAKAYEALYLQLTSPVSA